MKQPHLTNVWKFTRCSKLNCNQEIHLKDLKEKGKLDGAIQLYGLDTSSRGWWCDANIGQWRCLCVDKAWSQEEKLVWEPNLAASCKNNEVMYALSELIRHILLSNLLGPWCLNGTFCVFPSTRTLRNVMGLYLPLADKFNGRIAYERFSPPGAWDLGWFCGGPWGWPFDDLWLEKDAPKLVPHRYHLNYLWYLVTWAM